MEPQINDNLDLDQTCIPEDLTQEQGPVRSCITVKRKGSLTRLDKYLQGRFPRFSRTALARLIKEGAVTVNGGMAKPSYEICVGDRIELILPPKRVKEIEPEDIPLDVLYEDDHMVVINKPPGMVVHPARGSPHGTLVNALVHHCSTLANSDDPVRPGVVHRLDKDTTGVILAAKSDEAQWRLALQFERRRIHKEYLAVVEGEPELDSDHIDGPIGAHPRIRQRYAVRPGLGRPASTIYEVKERLGGFAFVQLKPATGRTHQLRVHMSSIRHPIVGDTLYGARRITVGELLGSDDDRLVIPRFALHAHLIQFRHPVSGNEMTIRAELPEDMENLLKTLRERAGRQPAGKNKK